MHPTIPTLAEQGHSDIEIETWFGLFAPAKTSPDRLDILRALFTVATNTVADEAAKQGFVVRTGSSAELAELVKKDIARFWSDHKGGRHRADVNDRTSVRSPPTGNDRRALDNGSR